MKERLEDYTRHTGKCARQKLLDEYCHTTWRNANTPTKACAGQAPLSQALSACAHWAYLPHGFEALFEHVFL